MMRSLILALAMVAVPAPPAAASHNCDHFASQADAQAAYLADPGGLYHLDRDRAGGRNVRDGIACEGNPAPYSCDIVPVEARVPPVLDPPTYPDWWASNCGG